MLFSFIIISNASFPISFIKGIKAPKESERIAVPVIHSFPFFFKFQGTVFQQEGLHQQEANLHHYNAEAAKLGSDGIEKGIPTLWGSKVIALRLQPISW